MDELEQYSRIDDVIITGLKTRHRSYANVTASAAPGGDSPQAELETLETQVVQFLSGRDLPIQHGNTDTSRIVTFSPANKPTRSSLRRS